MARYHRGMTSYATYLVLQGTTLCLNMLPLSVALWIGRCLGRMAFTLVRSRRTVALSNLQTAFGREKSSQEIENIARRTFANQGMTLVEFLRMPRLGMNYYHRYARVEGWEHMNRALEGGKGVIALTFHFGNWELPGLGASFFGFPIVALAQRIHNPWIDRYVRRTRRLTGVTILPKRRVTQQVIKHLRQGKIVAIFVDQRERTKSQVLVDFFGKRASTTPSPVIFSLRTGAPMIPLFTVREKLLSRDVEGLTALYDGEIQRVDGLVGELGSLLDASGLRDRTLVVFTSDHGQELLDHGGYTFSHTLYNEVLRVPLIIAGPQVVASGRSVETPVSTLDLVPTLAQVGGAPLPAEIEGTSLLPSLQGGILAEKPIFGESMYRVPQELKAIYRDGYKLIYNLDDGTSELYDLGVDPGEQQDLIDRSLGVAGALTSELLEWMAYSAQVAHTLPRTAPPTEFPNAPW